eukprot:Plantae.Rhodophyta-Hildenbrandia_rubra.ctg9883.p1 GENE.Plantae.Rhodophyta-Hildenbrandia_rubra.ctg9883~~Plantae.Rhodophyta-Hildenbrandia_rubra.ctg9883.p1  ORF type:complete len:218 (-),score=33.33 Plantae.Rhodophyta-Hildenbrandia_rubra.ctg9883:304-957(-)
MKLLSVAAALVALFAFATAAEKTPCTGDQAYAVKFYYQWTPERFPVDFPPTEENPTFSPLTGFSHNYRFSAWTVFGYADFGGVEMIAETGAPTMFLDALSNVTYVKESMAAEAPVAFDADETIQLTVDPENTRITAMTMVFPSPDWFTGVDNMEMCANDGTWINKKYGFLYALDAGTDSGELHLADDEDTQPRMNIAPILDSPFYGLPVGFYEIYTM